MAVGATVAVIALTAICHTAEARGRRHARHAAPVESYEPSYSSIVVDGNSGKVMQATNADSPRHPASLTKIMTLYLLFERLEAGKIKLTSEMPVSPHAASQAPSKLGLKPGETIKVETAIRAIVTKSANDVAVIVAEALGGDEASFAKLMTAKARALGMKGTSYYNASGLPQDQQYTTARDQALLGRAIRDRFPNFYPYFATRTFDFRGKSMRNHNHLLGAVEGVDGIKTGYIHDSGFNIVTSARRNGRHIVAVVFGGRTANVRDARVRGLIESNIDVAAAKRTSPLVVEGGDNTEIATKEPARETPKEAAKETAKEFPREPLREAKEAPKDSKEKAHIGILGAAPQVVASANAAETPALGSTDPIKPNAVKTFIVRPAGTMRTASLSSSPLPADHRKLAPMPASAQAATVTNIVTVKGEAPPLPADHRKLAPMPASAQAATVTNIVTVKGEAPPLPPPGAKPGVLGVLPVNKLASAGDTMPTVTATTIEPAKEAAAKPRIAGGWMIQVGAFPEEKEAKQRLEAAQSKAKDQLGRADPFTEKTMKGDKALFRARFAGLEKDQAENACHYLKRSEIPCMLVKN